MPAPRHPCQKCKRRPALWPVFGLCLPCIDAAMASACAPLLRQMRALVAAITGGAVPRVSAPSEIDLVAASAARWRGKLDAMADEWARRDGACCPGCMFGARYTYAADKLTRVSKWLAVLLRKRKGQGDFEAAAKYESGVWP